MNTYDAHSKGEKPTKKIQSVIGVLLSWTGELGEK